MEDEFVVLGRFEIGRFLAVLVGLEVTLKGWLVVVFD